ncbi:hypothetical protein Fmac_031760 [Flemingia macrophylla]|uniref:Uncharacterized protein n=1 Tax=Flemingia macrophylla TaxID=520843 RepID=A0ABD1L2Z2_9FABA
MGRAPCCDKANVKRGPWSPEEDATLKSYVQTHGTGGNWIALPKKAGLRRCGKSCRLRWLNYLRPDIKHGGFTEEEDNLICTLFAQMGSRWSAIASQLPGRTDNDVKNHWNTKLKKKIMAAGELSLKTLITNNDPLIPSTDPTPLTQNSVFPSQTQNSLPPMLSILDASSVFNNNINEQNISFDQTNGLYGPQVMDVVSEIGASSSNNNNNPMMVASLSEEGSSVSDSSSIAMNNKGSVSQPQHASGESMEMMDYFGFGSPYELVNGLNCHYERVGEFPPSWYPEWVDFSHANIKPH